MSRSILPASYYPSQNPIILPSGSEDYDAIRAAESITLNDAGLVNLGSVPEPSSPRFRNLVTVAPQNPIISGLPPLPVSSLGQLSNTQPMILPASPLSPRRTSSNPEFPKPSPIQLPTPTAGFLSPRGVNLGGVELTTIPHIREEGYNPKVDFHPYAVDTRRRAFFGNLETMVLDNTMFRKVIFTSRKEQIVAMCLHPGEEIGSEIHPATDQFFRIESGYGLFVVGSSESGKEEIAFGPGDAFQVPAGTEHNIISLSEDPINPGNQNLVKLYTIYSPPQHPYDTIDITKDDARIRESSSE
jgi:mannose-6-phosphate isomerase-like protein (cupin superfamily)